MNIKKKTAAQFENKNTLQFLNFLEPDYWNVEEAAVKKDNILFNIYFFHCTQKGQHFVKTFF